VITFEDFMKLEIRIGKVLTAEKVEGTDKLIKLEIDLGSEQRVLIAGVAESYEPEYLIGKEVPVLTNLEPCKIRGIMSQGMILAANVEGKPIVLHPEREVPPGTPVH
jgi:methionine--tRNA ligase beta chain